MAGEVLAFDGNGNYLRDADDGWCYTDGRDPVPGAHDLRLGQLYPAAAVRDGARRVRRVPLSWLSRRADHPLAWVHDVGRPAPPEASSTAQPSRSARAAGARPVDQAGATSRGGRGGAGSLPPALYVSATVWLRHADDIVGMTAPELHPAALLGTSDVAALAGVSEGTLRAYLHRQQMPRPITRIGSAPVWSRPIVERWLAGRRARAAADR